LEVEIVGSRIVYTGVQEDLNLYFILEIDNTSNKLELNYICRRALLFDIIIVCYNFLFLNLDKRTCISDKLIQVHINTGSHHKVYWRQC